MNNHKKRLLNIFIAFVWLINGLYCKVLNLVPRHQEIVGRILGNQNAAIFTKLIGFSEILMCIWILIGYKRRWNAVTQMIIIAVMNILEFFLVPDLLLWGKMNSIFAFLFICLIYFNEFLFNNTENQ